MYRESTASWGSVMRIAALGAAAAAMLGGTLAVSPVSSVGPPTPSGAVCANSAAGADCDRLASVLMPNSAAQSGQAAQALPPAVSVARAPEAAGPIEHFMPSPFSAAGQVIAPAVAPRSGSSPTALPVLDDPGLPGVPDPNLLAGLPNAGALATAPGLADLGMLGLPGFAVPALGIGLPNFWAGLGIAQSVAWSVVGGVQGLGGLASSALGWSTAVGVPTALLALDLIEPALASALGLNSESGGVAGLLNPTQGIPSSIAGGLQSLLAGLNIPGIPSGDIPQLLAGALPAVLTGGPASLLLALGNPSLLTSVGSALTAGLPALLAAVNPALAAGLGAVAGGLPALADIPAFVAGLPASLAALMAGLPAAALPALAPGLPALPPGLPAPGLPALPPGLPAPGLPAPGLPAPPAVLAALPHPQLPAQPPPPALPALPPPPHVCGPQLGPFKACT